MEHKTAARAVMAMMIIGLAACGSDDDAVAAPEARLDPATGVLTLRSVLVAAAGDGNPFTALARQP